MVLKAASSKVDNFDGTFLGVSEKYVFWLEIAVDYIHALHVAEHNDELLCKCLDKLEFKALYNKSTR